MKSAERLTDKLVRGLPTPATAAVITYDSALAGFGIRITSAGYRSFVLNYRLRSGRERRLTIGPFPAWSTSAARQYAADLKLKIRLGHDPLGDLEQERGAPTIARLIDRFTAEYMDRLRPATRELYSQLLNGPKQRRSTAFEGVRRAWGHRKVDSITFGDVQALHARVSAAGTPVTANRLASVLSRLFGLAIRWGWRSDNPVAGIERNQETPRERYLRPDEIARLHEALVSFPDQQTANIVRLLMLTGSRSAEIFGLRWDQLDLAAGVWTKPSSATKQKATHRTPLSRPARLLLANLPQEGEWVFPSASSSGHRTSVSRAWPRLCEAAGLVDLRPHDLRHSFASVLVSAGLSLPIIGALLGHSQPRTTARYAHLADDPLRAATEQAAKIIGGERSAKIVPLC